MPQLEGVRAAEFRSLLRARSTTLREEIRTTLERSGEESHARIAEQARDTEDDSFADLIVDVNNAEVTRDLNELRQIDGAMQRLLDGSYGVCRNCGIEIPIERLRAQPTATRCIRCQSIYEQTHAQGRGPTL
jgi:RNA polymerase-binding protein DksA